jgi:hypothetical protein
VPPALASSFDGHFVHSSAECLHALLHDAWDALILDDGLPAAGGLSVLEGAAVRGFSLPTLFIGDPTAPARTEEAFRRYGALCLPRNDCIADFLKPALTQAREIHELRARGRSGRPPALEEPAREVLRVSRHLWHEAQNQLFAIEGSLELLEASATSGAEEHRERIRRACSRLDFLFQDLRAAGHRLELALAERRDRVTG